MESEDRNTPSGVSLSELHLLLTYRCNYSCSHCFVWGGPTQTGTMTIADVERILDEAVATGTIRRIYFEGGETFLYYPILLAGVQLAQDRGLEVGIVTNAYWATSVDDAQAWLQPLADRVVDLSISSDVYHGSGRGLDRPAIAGRAAARLGIPTDYISVAAPGESAAKLAPVHFRGRASQLASLVAASPWAGFDECPWEDLEQPGRVHVDAFGHLHICQGISIGNLYEQPLAEIMRQFDPHAHPIVGPLLAGGPAEIVRAYGVEHEEGYADHCHLCYEARSALRERFPEVLAPDQMYGPAG